MTKASNILKKLEEASYPILMKMLKEIGVEDAQKLLNKDPKKSARIEKDLKSLSKSELQDFVDGESDKVSKETVDFFGSIL
jgi:ferritin-like metal-binding protein YciE